MYLFTFSPLKQSSALKDDDKSSRFKIAETIHFQRQQRTLNISISPHIDSEGLSKCVHSLFSSDWNFDNRISRSEFNIVIAKLTDDTIPALTSADSAQIQKTFEKYACTVRQFCNDDQEEEESAKLLCCDEELDSYILIGHFDEFSEAEDQLLPLCTDIEEAIKTVLDAFPSAIPTHLSSSIPTSKPTPLSSTIPSKKPSVAPSNQPFDNPTFIFKTESPPSSNNDAPTFIFKTESPSSSNNTSDSKRELEPSTTFLAILFTSWALLSLVF